MVSNTDFLEAQPSIPNLETARQRLDFLKNNTVCINQVFEPASATHNLTFWIKSFEGVIIRMKLELLVRILAVEKHVAILLPPLLAKVT